MLNLRREHVEKTKDLRGDPRIEFHIPAAIIGIDSEASIIDFSLGGFYIETHSNQILKPGQKVSISLKLPNERIGITVKAQVMYSSDGGFGCKLLEPTVETISVLEECFNIFSGTLPVAIESEADVHNIVVA
jgi:hypothetical protein